MGKKSNGNLRWKDLDSLERYFALRNAEDARLSAEPKALLVAFVDGKLDSIDGTEPRPLSRQKELARQCNRAKSFKRAGIRFKAVPILED